MATLKVRRGFTLVELLVVIAIIGVLVGLLAPAVQAVREASRAMSCRNNLNQLKTAIAIRETSLGMLPGYVNNIGVKGTNLQVRASWVVTLLPYLEQQAVWQRWSQGRLHFENGRLDAAYRPYLEILVCPSDPPTDTRLPSLSYVASAGCLRRSQGSCVAGFTPNNRSPFQQVGEDPANGLSDQIDLLTYAQLMTSNRQQTDLQQGGVFENDLPPPSDDAY